MSKEKLLPMNTEGQITFRIEAMAIEKDINSALALPADMLFAPMTSRVMCIDLDWRKAWLMIANS